MLGSSRHRLTRAGRLVAGALCLVVGGGLAGVPIVQGRASATSVPSSNLVVGSTAALTTGTGTWTGSNVKTLTTKVWPAGNGSLVMSATGPGTVTVQTGTGRHGTIRATPGGVYSGQLNVATAATTEQTQAALVWYDASGDEVVRDRVTGAATPDTSSSWTQVTVAGVAPASAAFVALAIRLPATVAGETHYLSTPQLTATTGTSSALAGPLHTSGNKIYDVNNRPVTLRGMNRSGLYNTATPGNLTQYDISRIKAWGGNVVRITLGEQVWLPGCSSYNPTYPAVVDQTIKWINDLGMLAVVDLQWSAPTCGTAGLNPMPDANSTKFWQQVSTLYANRPLVAFDLFNEPHDVSDAIWANGGPTTTASGVAYQAVGMRDLYTTVRGLGAQNLVFVGGLGYASTWPTTAPLPATTNVVYAVHAYVCDKPWMCTNGTGISWMLNAFVAPGQSNPIMVTEFGWPDATTRQAQAFNTNVITFAEAYGWGWLAWAWDVDGTCSTALYFDLLTSCGAGDAYQPAPAAMPILQGLAKNS